MQLKSVYLLFEFCCMLALFGQTRSFTYENVTLLKTNLLHEYDTDLRPLHNQSEALNLTVSLSLYRVLEIDTVRGVMTTIMSLECYWKDERIRWKPSDYGGIASIMVQQKHVWTPPLILGQPVDFTAIGEPWMHVKYQFDGSAHWSPGGVIQSTCPMNMQYWPFDEQTCEISFFPYDHKKAEIQIYADQLLSSVFKENGEWSLEKTEAVTSNACDFSTPEALFKVTLKRRSVFYVMTLILPLFGLCILTGFVFLLPSDSGERVSYSITIPLALTVFLTVMSDNIPKLSNPVPLLCIFLIVGIILSSITTLIVILNLAVYHRSPKMPIEPRFVSLVQILRCRSRKVYADELIQEQLNAMKKDTPDKHDKKMTVTSINSKDISKHLRPTSPRLVNEVTGGVGDVVTWKDVSQAIDSIMFVAMMTLQIVPVAVLVIVLVCQ